MKLPQIEITIKYKGSKKTELTRINNSSDIYSILKEMFNAEIIDWQEQVILICLNQYNKVIGYSLPKQPTNTIFKLIFKLYRYPDHITNFFSIKNNMVIKRQKAMRKLNKYLIKQNMVNNTVSNYLINVKQDKDGISNNFFKL